MRKPPSWLIVCLLLYLFFPVGIWLLVRKVNGEKHRYRENGKALKILAVVLFVIAGFGILTSVSEFTAAENNSGAVSLLIPTLLLVGGGVLSLVKGRKLMKMGERFEFYKFRFEQSGVLELDPVAAELNITYEQLVSDLKEMIAVGYIDNAFIDFSARCLAQKVRRNRTYVVNCPHCGGISEISNGENAVCSYCGSAL